MGSSPNGTVRDKARGRAEPTAEMALIAHLNSLNFSLYVGRDVTKIVFISFI